MASILEIDSLAYFNKQKAKRKAASEEISKIKSETEALQRSMGEQVAGKRKSRIGRSAGLMSSATIDTIGTNNQSLG